MGYVVAEGGHGTVVVGPAPLAENIGEAVNKHPCPSLLRIFEEQLLAGAFRLTVGIVEPGLDRRRQHHGTSVVVLLERVEQRGGESEVPLHEFRVFLGPVHACGMHDEIAVSTKAVKISFGVISVILIYFTNLEIGPRSVFSVTDCFQIFYQIAT